MKERFYTPELAVHLRDALRGLRQWIRQAGVGRWPTLNLALFGVLAGASASAATTVIDAGAVYPEGPLWRNGELLYVEYGADDIKRWTGHGKADVYWKQQGCGPSGLIDYGATHLLVACYDANSLVELDATGRTVRTIEQDSTGHPFTGPNDFAADAKGGLYFSASGVYDLAAPITGAVLYLSSAGEVTQVADTIHYSNGLTLSRDGKTLLVAEGLAGRVLAFPVREDGTLGPRTVWARLRDLAPPTPHEDAFNGPDGLKLGPDGNYYIAQNGSSRVLVVTPGKKLVRSVRVATPYVTNMNFGGDGAKTLYITAVIDPWKAPYPGKVYRYTVGKPP